MCKSANKLCLILLKYVFFFKRPCFYSSLNNASTCSCSHKNCSKIHDKRWMETTFSMSSPKSTKIYGLLSITNRMDLPHLIRAPLLPK